MNAPAAPTLALLQLWVGEGLLLGLLHERPFLSFPSSHPRGWPPPLQPGHRLPSLQSSRKTLLEAFSLLPCPPLDQILLPRVRGWGCAGECGLSWAVSQPHRSLEGRRGVLGRQLCLFQFCFLTCRLGGVRKRTERSAWITGPPGRVWMERETDTGSWEPPNWPSPSLPPCNAGGVTSSSGTEFPKPSNVGVRDSKLEGPFWKVPESLKCVVRGFGRRVRYFLCSGLFGIGPLPGCDLPSTCPRLAGPRPGTLSWAFWCSWHGCDLKSALWY